MSPSRQSRATVSDVVEVVKVYALQEIVDPLKGIGRWIGAGIAGSILLGLGLLVLLMGVLRLLQDVGEDVFDYKWSFVPYVIVLVITVGILAIVASRIKRTGLSSREPPR
jgi:hypothetical protein